MWIRAAYFEGKIFPDNLARFQLIVNGEIVPGIRASPGVRRVNAWWPQKYEDRSEEVFRRIVVEFAAESGIADMLASPERRALRERVLELVPFFDGKISRINFESPGKRSGSAGFY